jgi:hypothetical protein
MIELSGHWFWALDSDKALQVAEHALHVHQYHHGNEKGTLLE